MLGTFGGIFGAVADLTDAAFDTGRHLALLAHGTGNLMVEVVDHAHLFGDVGQCRVGLLHLFHTVTCRRQRLLHHGHRLLGIILQFGDDVVDLLGRVVGAARQGANLIRHNRKTTPLLTGASRLNGCIKRQQVGLLGDLLDHLQYRAHVLTLAVQLLNHLRCAVDVLLQAGNGGNRLLGYPGAVTAFLQCHVGGRYRVFGTGRYAAGGGFHLLHGRGDGTGLHLLMVYRLSGFGCDPADSAAGVSQPGNGLAYLLHAVVDILQHGVEGGGHLADFIIGTHRSALVQIIVALDGVDGFRQTVNRHDDHASQQQADQNNAGHKQRQLDQCDTDQVAVDLFVQGFIGVGYAHGTHNLALLNLVAEQAVGTLVVRQGAHGCYHHQPVPLRVIKLFHDLLATHGALVIFIHRFGIRRAGTIHIINLFAADDACFGNGWIGQDFFLQRATVGHGAAEHQHVDAVEVGVGSVEGGAGHHLVNQRGFTAVNGGQRADENNQEYSDQQEIDLVLNR